VDANRPNEAIPMNWIYWVGPNRAAKFLGHFLQACISGEEVSESLQARLKNEPRAALSERQKQVPDLLSPPHAIAKGFQVIKPVHLRVEEVEHCEEVALVIQDGRCREEQYAVRRLTEPLEGSEALLLSRFLQERFGRDMLGLIDDDEAPRAATQSLADFTRSNHLDSPRPETRSLKFRFEFLPPLVNEERGDEHSRRCPRVVEQELAEDDAGLDGLPEADLVAEEVALNGVFEHSADGLNLVGEQLDARGQEARHATGGRTLPGE
jgi:hypothetical protein